mgnify:CR=1 FL=1
MDSIHYFGDGFSQRRSPDNPSSELFSDTLTFYYKELEIGEYHSYPIDSVDGYLAIAWAPLGSTLGYPEDFMVWNKFTKKWLRLEVPSLCAGLGFRVADAPR